MATTPVLNLALIDDHEMRHETVFESFEKLKRGEAFIIRNDHDPFPLYFQLKNRNGDIVRWDYVKRGPDFWDVKVTKTQEPG